MIRQYLTIGLVLLVAFAIVIGAALWKGVESFLFAWILHFMLMMSVLTFTQTFKPRLTSSYYKLKKWEAGGEIYKWIGVNAFRKLLVWVGWEKLNKAANPVKKRLDALEHLEYTSRQSEFGHLLIFFVVLLLSFWVGYTYGFSETRWLLGLNVVLNAYPIVVQRYNRPRYQKAINRIKGY